MAEQTDQPINEADLEQLDEVSDQPEAGEAEEAKPSFNIPVEEGPAEVVSEPVAEAEEVSAPASNPVKDAEARLEKATAALNKARNQFEKASKEFSEASVDLVKIKNKTGNVPLHVLNASAKVATRVEDRKRQLATEAIADLTNHFRYGKRVYPVHPSARGKVSEE